MNLPKTRLAIAGVGLTAAGLLAWGGTSSAGVETKTFKDKVLSLDCNSGEPTLTAIVELVDHDSASTSPDDALDALIAANFQELRDERHRFTKSSTGDESMIDFDFEKDGKKKLVVVAERVSDDNWGIQGYALCPTSIKGES